MKVRKAGLVAGVLAMVLGAGTAFAGGIEEYHNPRFDIVGWLPPGFVAEPAPENGDGRVFDSPRDSGQITIFGSFNLRDSFAGYRSFYRAQMRAGGARITLDTGGSNWFVLSGFQGPRIFYLRVEEGVNCSGYSVLAHWQIEYLPQDRPVYDPQIGRLTKGLRVGSC